MENYVISAFLLIFLKYVPSMSDWNIITLLFFTHYLIYHDFCVFLHNDQIWRSLKKKSPVLGPKNESECYFFYFESLFDYGANFLSIWLNMLQKIDKKNIKSWILLTVWYHFIEFDLTIGLEQLSSFTHLSNL